MIHIRDECEQIKFGFNFYPFKSNNFGFVLWLKNGRLWHFRYNKKTSGLWLNDKYIQLRKKNEENL